MFELYIGKAVNSISEFKYSRQYQDRAYSLSWIVLCVASSLTLLAVVNGRSAI